MRLREMKKQAREDLKEAQELMELLDGATEENIGSNGVKAYKITFSNGDTQVETDCGCFGSGKSTHDNLMCPVAQKQMKNRKPREIKTFPRPE